MVENGLYKIKYEYYTDFPHEKHIQNKGDRPFCYAVKGNDNIFWFIPLSTIPLLKITPMALTAFAFVILKLKNRRLKV